MNLSCARAVPSLILALCLAACGGGKTAAVAASVVTPSTTASAASAPAPAALAALVLPAVTTAALGSTVALTAQAADTSGTAVSGVALTWSSADTSIATIDSTGVLTPVRAGYTTIKVAANGLSASGTVSVRGALTLPVRSQYVGTNLGGIAYYSSQFPFADMMKNSGGWSSRDDNGVWGAAFPSMTSDGYPAALSPGQHALAAVAWGGSNFQAGRYVVLWDGDGAVSFPLSNVKIAESAANRIAIDVSDTTGSLWVSIDRASASNPVHNVRFLWPGTEATYATRPFNPQFLSRIAPFSLLRFMDWGVTNGSAIVEWADRSHPGDLNYAGAGGVPIEVMIDLANTLHVDPWFCIPHQASDDYVKQFATLLHARLDPALHPHIEYSNEMWNTGFAQTAWANARSQALGLDSPSGQPAIFYATRSVQIFKIMQGVYGADSARLVRVLAGQAAWNNFLSAMLAYKDTAANADVMAIAPYFTAAAAGDASQVDATLKLTSDQIIDQMLVSVRGDIKSWMTSNAALAKKYKLTLKAYESGPGDTANSFAANKQDAITALFTAANNNPRMRDVYLEFYGQWLAAGGDTMNQYNDIGNWSKYGLWGALQSVMQDPASSPKYQGLLAFIAAHPAP